MDSLSVGIVPFILSSLAQLLAKVDARWHCLMTMDGWITVTGVEDRRWVTLPVPALERTVCLMTLPHFTAGAEEEQDFGDLR